MTTFLNPTDQVQALYVGYFGRAGDPAGANFWIGNLVNGANTLNQEAALFAGQPESIAKYPYLADPFVANPQLFITQVYQNLFNRPPEPAGLAFWSAKLELAKGSPQAVGQFILDVISGATGVDNLTIQNKVAVARDFTAQIANANIQWNATIQQESMELIAATTSNAATVDAAKAATTAFIASGEYTGITYGVAASAASIVEGQTETFTISTTGVDPGTKLAYTITGTGNAAGATTSGEVTLDASGKAVVSVPTVQNGVAGDSGTLVLALANGRATSPTVVVNDTAAFTITRSAAVIAEGETQTFTITTTGVAPGTKLAYTITGTGNAASATTSGEVTLDASGRAAVSVPTVLDGTAGNTGTLVMQLANGTSSPTVLVRDGSDFTITASAPVIAEGETETFTISTTGVAAGTKLAYTITGTGNAAGQTSSGEVTLDASGRAVVSVTVPANPFADLTGTLVLSLANGLATSPTVDVIDNIEVVYTLTPGFDGLSTMTGTPKGDTYVANNLTFNTGDNLNGMGGFNKLDLLLVGPNSGQVQTANIQQMNITADVDSSVDGVLWSGFEQVWSRDSSGDLAVNNLQAMATVGVQDGNGSDYAVTFRNTLASGPANSVNVALVDADVGVLSITGNNGGKFEEVRINAVAGANQVDVLATAPFVDPTAERLALAAAEAEAEADAATLAAANAALGQAGYNFASAGVALQAATVTLGDGGATPTATPTVFSLDVLIGGTGGAPATYTINFAYTIGGSPLTGDITVVGANSEQTMGGEIAQALANFNWGGTGTVTASYNNGNNTVDVTFQPDGTDAMTAFSVTSVTPSGGNRTLSLPFDGAPIWGEDAGALGAGAYQYYLDALAAVAAQNTELANLANDYAAKEALLTAATNNYNEAYDNEQAALAAKNAATANLAAANAESTQATLDATRAQAVETAMLSASSGATASSFRVNVDNNGQVDGSLTLTVTDGGIVSSFTVNYTIANNAQNTASNIAGALNNYVYLNGIFAATQTGSNAYATVTFTPNGWAALTAVSEAENGISITNTAFGSNGSVTTTQLVAAAQAALSTTDGSEADAAVLYAAQEAAGQASATTTTVMAAAVSVVDAYYAEQTQATAAASVAAAALTAANTAEGVTSAALTAAELALGIATDNRAQAWADLEIGLAEYPGLYNVLASAYLAWQDALAAYNTALANYEFAQLQFVSAAANQNAAQQAYDDALQGVALAEAALLAAFNAAIAATSAVETLVVDGEGSLTIDAILGAEVRNVDASQNNGGIDLDLSGASGYSLIGSQAADRIVANDGTDVSINLQNGNDLLIFEGPLADAVLNGGGDRDTLEATSVILTTGLNTASISSFEILTVTTALAAPLNVNNASGVDTVNLLSGIAGGTNTVTFQSGIASTLNLFSAAGNTINVASGAGLTDQVTIANQAFATDVFGGVAVAATGIETLVIDGSGFGPATTQTIGNVAVAGSGAAQATLSLVGSNAITAGVLNARHVTAAGLIGAVGLTATTAENGYVAGTVFSFLGSTKADTITLGSSRQDLNLNDGNDTLIVTDAIANAIYNGGNPGGSLYALDGGSGDFDRVQLTADRAALLSTNNNFGSFLTGFEVLRITGNDVGSLVINTPELGFSFVESALTGTTDVTLQDFANNGTLKLTAAATGAGFTVNVDGSAARLTDVLNIALESAAALAGGTVTAQFVERVNISTIDTNATTHVDTLTLVDGSARTITVSGNAGLDLTFAGTNLISFDASDVTKGAVSWTTAGLTSAADIRGGNDGNVIDFSAATKIVTFNGGAGGDVVTALNNQNNTINTYADDDEVFLGTGRNTVDLGLGSDVVWLGNNINFVDLGIGGTDTVHVVAPTNGNTYSSIFNAGAGDIFDFAAVVTNSSADFQQGIVLQPTAGFRDYLDAATAASVPADAANWFTYLGNTYIVQNVDAAVTFQDGTDVVVQLVGLVDLSTATVTGGNILLA